MKKWSKSQNIKNTADFFKNFKCPDNMYRPIPFWSLNDQLEPVEMGRQMKIMAEKGLGGSFLHARSGLRTPYMGEEWMNCIASAVDQSVKDGTYAWLYDENGWPSGFANGEVTSKGVAYQQKHLTYAEISESEIDFDEDMLLGYYILKNNTASRLNDANEVKNRSYDKLIKISYQVNKYYIDILNEEVVSYFIETTHERYKRRFEKHFGKNIPGIFTDEPQHAVGGKPPYSFILPQEFEQEHQYDLMDMLPAVFIDCSIETPDGIFDCMQVRYDYRKTVSRLLTSSFAKQIGNWCEQNNLSLTGHFISEDSLLVQVDCSSGVMPSYEYMQVPGIDWLMRHVGDILTAKQVSSVANQMDRRFCISETFGCTGWNISFEDLRWIAEYQYVLGINMMCQHLEWYSMRGNRKRDYPPSLYFQQPWWDKYNLFNNYFARLGSIISDNKLVCDILILHPLHSAWMLFRPFTVGDLDEKLNTLMKGLLENHFDFELADETIMSHIGEVVKVGIKPYLRMGQCCYSTVIIPSSYNLDSTTLSLLYEFALQGGTILCFDRKPGRINGREPLPDSDESEKLAFIYSKAKAADDIHQITECLEQLGLKRIWVENESGNKSGNIFTRLMNNDDGCTFCYAVNHSETQGGSYRIKMNGHRKVFLLNLLTGKIEKYQADICGDKTEFYAPISAQDSKMFITEEIGSSAIEKSVESPITDYVDINNIKSDVIYEGLDHFEVKRDQFNALTVDYLDYSFDGGDWVCNVPAIELQNMLVRLGRPTDVKLRYHFIISEETDLSRIKEIYFACEDPLKYTLELNGERYIFHDCGCWRDPCIRISNIKDSIKKGKNTIVMGTRFQVSDEVYHLMTDEGVHECAKNNITFDTEIESVYIIGDFGVFSDNLYTYDGKKVYNDGGFFISEEQGSINPHRTIECGLPFYSGNLSLSDTFYLADKNPQSRYILGLQKRPDAVLSEIRINGAKAADIAWAPYAVDITEYVKEGTNKIEVILYGSCRNSFGPHHHVLGEPKGICPASFEKYKGWIDWNLEDPLIWRDRYCFVNFGLADCVKIAEARQAR